MRPALFRRRGAQRRATFARTFGRDGRVINSSFEGFRLGRGLAVGAAALAIGRFRSGLSYAIAMTAKTAIAIAMAHEPINCRRNIQFAG